MDLNGEVSNFENEIFYNRVLDKKNFKVSDFAIHLHLIGNFYKLVY